MNGRATVAGGVDSLALYGRYLAIAVRGQMQYRGAFLTAVVGQFLITGVEFLGLWALFDRFGHLSGWSFPEVALFYGVVNCAFAVAEALGDGFDRFGALFVKSGDFDRLLLRPRSTVLQLAGHDLALRKIGRLLQGAIVLAWAGSALDIDWNLARIALLALTLAGGVAFFFALNVLQATLSFWTVESLEMMNILTYGGVETAQYPLTIYHRAFRRFFTFVVPLACVSYFPVVALLGATDPLGSGRAAQHLAPLAGFLFLAGALGAWRLGTRHYASTGS